MTWVWVILCNLETRRYRRISTIHQNYDIQGKNGQNSGKIPYPSITNPSNPQLSWDEAPNIHPPSITGPCPNSPRILFSQSQNITHVLLYLPTSNIYFFSPIHQLYFRFTKRNRARLVHFDSLYYEGEPWGTPKHDELVPPRFLDLATHERESIYCTGGVG